MIIAIPSTLLVGIISGKIWLTMGLFVLLVLIGFLVINFFLQKFIYRKIKLIYKTIHRYNTQHISEKISLSDPISEVSEDVTSWANERRAEIELLKKQEAFRREFIGNISHELKTPIFQIQGFIHTLLEGALSDPNVNYRFLSKAGNSADRLAELVNDLGNISQLEGGQFALNITKFDPYEMVLEVYDELEYSVKENFMKLGFKDGSEKNLKVKADRSRIKQVVANLVVNAIKYGKKHGEIKAGLYDMDGYVLIEISDDGDGIPEESLPRLFERFYRVEKSRNRGAGGSGLGLSIAKHIIEAHGESIHVRSKIGFGSTFSFTLKKAK